MSNSNNIYNILGKLAALAPKQETSKEAAKKIYESVEAQGSVLAGVDAVESRLLKEFAETQVSEKAVSKAQQKFMGMVHAAQKGEKAASPKVAKVAKSMGKKDAKDFASTKHAGLPAHVEETGEVCAECGMMESECGCDHTNEGEITHPSKGVTRHTKTDFPGYPADDINKDDGEPKGRGRPRKHAIKAPKTDAEGNKLGRGRPKKDAAPTYSTSNDPFGRVPSKAPKSKIKGRVHTMGEAMSKLEQRFQQISEGVNFAELLKSKHQTVDEMLAELSDDIKLFKDTGHCSELLRDCMEIKGYHGKMIADETAQGGIPGNLPAPQVPGKSSLLNPTKPGVMGAVKDVAKGFKDFVTGKPETGATYEEVAMEDELNELAKLAGLSTEGNAFTGKLASTPKGGEFELDGKTFKDNSDLGEADMEEGNEFSGELAKAKATGASEFEVDGKTYPVKEDEIEVDEPTEDELANDPDEQYGTIKQITTQGDDMNRQKRQDPHTANKAANPFTNDKLTLEDRLAAEYESIKKVTK